MVKCVVISVLAGFLNPDDKYTLRAVCRNFAKGRGRTWDILEGGGTQLQAVSGGALKDNVVPHST